ncbi:hypothetical protein [Parafilimonas sp.]|uniref:hypothetical protein n=1 Tax=Parafilimonas sp. TaxID=1969739 RepID=UPI0039E5F2A6
MLNFKLKRLPALVTCLCLWLQLPAQDNTALLREAKQLELKFDEAGALEKYKQAAEADASNTNALVKCAELSCSIGNREKDAASKAGYFSKAFAYAQKAYANDSANADACYAMALVNYRMAALGTGNKELTENIKQTKIFADKSLAANSNNAKANYVLGMWHFELIRSGWLKKKGVKDFYNKIPDTQVDSAAWFMEKARSIDPYFAQDHLDLAKVYIYDHQPAKALEVLNKLVKLPNRIYDDAAYKAEGKQLLAKNQ